MSGFLKCMEANCALEDVEGNAIMSPRSWGQLVMTRTADGEYVDGTVKALERTKYRPTTAIPNNLGAGENESIMFVGDFRQLVLGVRQEATIEALKLQSYGDNLMLEFVGTARVDFLCRRPASFTEITGLTP
jgi:HK97 family phage major capsid protein